MHQPLKFLSFVTATLLLSLASPLALAATTLEISSALAQAPTPQDNKATINVEGAWNITEAKTLDGRNYTGTVAIQPIGQIYALSWKTSAGNQSGIAFLEDGHLLAGWGTDEAAGYGVVVYKIGKDGTLDGKWTYSKQGGEIGTETATGGRPDQIEGDYQVSGTNPNETARYKGTLNIRRTGDTYQLTWAVGTSYLGVGIRSGDWLVVSWGQSEQLGVVDYAISGKKASGRSARFNQSSLSVENLVHSQATANLSLSCTPAQTPTTQNRKAQADCFLEQGIKQIDTNRFQVGLQSLQQALAIYQEIRDRQGEGQTLKNLGNAYYGLKDYVKAREYQQQALAIAREIRDRELEGRALNNLGLAYKELGDSAKAIESYQQALAIAQEIHNRKLEQIALNNLGFIYVGQGNSAKVVEYYQQVLPLARELKERSTEAAALAYLGDAYASLNENQKAIEFAQQALPLARETKNPRAEAIALDTLSRTYSSLGDAQKSLEFAQQSLVVARQIKNNFFEVRALAFIADAYASLKENQKALEFAQQALPLARETKNSWAKALALDTLSRTYSSLGDAQKSLEFAQQSLVVARQIKNNVLEVRALAFIADAYASLKENQKALEFAQQALPLARETKNPQAEAIALDTLSRTYSSLDDAQKSLEFAQQSLTVARQIKNNFLEVRALAFIADAYASLSENQKALEFAQQALPLARETKNPQAEAIALDTLSRTYSSLGDAQKSLEFAQQSLTVARQIKNNFLEVRALAFIADAYASLKENQKALEFAQQCFALAREIKNRDLESMSLIVKSRVYWLQKDYQKMIEFTQESLAIAREIKNRSLESIALSQLGAAYWALRDYHKGIEYGQQALAIHRELKDRSSELSTLHSLGVNYFYLGDYQKAIELFQQELVFAREIKNHDYEGTALAHLGFAYFAQGDSQKIIEYGQQALAVGRENKSPVAEFIGLLALSIGYGNLGNNEKALEFSQSGLAIAKDPKVRQQLFSNAEELVLNVMGSLYKKVGRKEQAIAAYRGTLAIDNGYFTAQVGLARTYRELNMPITAITYYKQAISNIEQIRGKIPGLNRQSQEFFLQAIIDIDRTRNADIYRELADLLLSQGRILEAQQVLELLKVQELRDFTGNRRAGGQTKETVFTSTEAQILKENGSLIAFGQKVYECQKNQCSQLSQLLDQRDALTDHFNQKMQTIEQEVRDRRAKDDAFFDPTKLAKAREIVEAQPGTVLIYPFILEDKIWLLWTSKGGVVKSVEVPVGRSQLEKTVFNFRQLLQNPSSDITQVKATSKQLYDWLIKPIEPELRANKIQNLVFSLDRAARYIPMSALFDGEKYLVENYAVSTVVSADLTNTSDRLAPGTQNTSVLALGLSDAVPGFNPLPNVPAELDAIVRKKPNDTKGIYPGLEFLNSAFDFRALRDHLLGHQLLHIATHGEFVPGSPDSSYLLLGTGEKLAIPQIATLQDLGKVQLVVLSACQTALAERGQDGNEINGISYYFLNGGAKAVMASLWSVNDDSTRLLMQNFYGNLAKGTSTTPITKAQALQQAQLNLLHGQSSTTPNPDQRASLAPEARPVSQIASTNSTTSSFSHPYYWAPFILIGNSL